MPLHHPQRLVGGTTVPLRFEEWIIYRLHVEMHQRGNWSGEIEELVPMLILNPRMTLDPLGMAA